MNEELNNKNKNHNKIKMIVTIAIFAALSTVLYFLKFPLPFLFPSFLKIQFSNLPVIIIGFLLGPISGLLTLIIRTLIVLPFSESIYVGELADLLIGICVSLSSSLIYKFVHTKKGAVLGLIASTISWIIISVISNYFILVPFYLKLWCDGDVNTFIGALSIIPNVTVDNYKILYIIFAVIPFNILISIIVNVVTYFTYKKISIFIKSR